MFLFYLISFHYIRLDYVSINLIQFDLPDFWLGQIQDNIEGHTCKVHPLAFYAAKHWTTHAQFKEVSTESSIRQESTSRAKWNIYTWSFYSAVGHRYCDSVPVGPVL